MYRRLRFIEGRLQSCTRPVLNCKEVGLDLAMVKTLQHLK